jgi:hypothetical protein
MSRRLVLLLALVLAVSLAGCSGLWDRVYYPELPEVERLLKGIPSITVKRYWGDRDVFRVKHICAIIEIGKREAFIGNLTPASFRRGGTFLLYYVGEQAPTTRSFGYMGAFETASGHPVPSDASGVGIGLGTGTAFASLIPLPIESVRDFVQHAEDVEHILASWPRCPAFFSFAHTEDGHPQRDRICSQRWDTSGEPPSFVYPPPF